MQMQHHGVKLNILYYSVKPNINKYLKAILLGALYCIYLCSKYNKGLKTYIVPALKAHYSIVTERK